MTIKFDEVTIRKLFGHEAAEDEDIEHLKRYFLRNKIYEKFAVDLPLRILVGHKGTGKSALLKIAKQEDEEKGFLHIDLQPNDLVDINSTSQDFLRSIREWESKLTQVICDKVFNSLGMNGNSNWEHAKNYGAKFMSYLSETIQTSSESISLDLNPTKKISLSNFLKNNKIIVYIDDLDRGWSGSKDDITRISSLLNAIRDIINENKGINFRIALRSDVYFLVRTSDESTDKIESSVVWYNWSNHEILVMLAKRIQTYMGIEVVEEKLKQLNQYELSDQYINKIMEPLFSGTGKWYRAPMHRVLMSLIRKRPRDLVKLCTLAARKAYEDDSSLIQTRHFKEIFEEYSQGRIQDTINEYKTELPDIERLLLNMKPNRIERRAANGWQYTNEQLASKISNIVQSGKFTFNNGKEASVKQLSNFLYKINFLTARKDIVDLGVIRKYFEENRYISGEHSDFGFTFEVHPAYRWALQVDSIEDIYKQVELSLE